MRERKERKKRRKRQASTAGNKQRKLDRYLPYLRKTSWIGGHTLPDKGRRSEEGKSKTGKGRQRNAYVNYIRKYHIYMYMMNGMKSSQIQIQMGEDRRGE
jgi:hypothetical protein